MEFDEEYKGTPYAWIAMATCPICNSRLIIKPIDAKPNGSLEILVVAIDEGEKRER